jgi:hypothetical protein
MPGSKRKNKNPTSDFKRLKAKVGKKARKALNDTDVSFQATSLRVAGQSIQNGIVADNNLVLSSRGKSLDDLSSQLSHPAAAVRASALKGMLNIVKTHSSDTLLPHFSTLIPAFVHSLIDEDEDVRSLGNDAISILARVDEIRIQPFAPLVMARILSALHSLDPFIRIDGVKMARIISSCCPSMTSRYVSKIISPYIGLLSDQRTQKFIDDTLLSLVSLLKVAAWGAKFESIKRQRNSGPDLVYAMGQRSRNAVVFAGRYRRCLQHALVSVEQLPCLDHDSHFQLGKEVKSTSVRASSDGITRTSLLSKLCDCLVESTSCRSDPTFTDITTDGMNVSRVLLVLRAIRLLAKFNQAEQQIGNDADVEFDETARRIIKLMMEIFPVEDDSKYSHETSSGKQHKLSNGEDVNVAIATTFLDLAFNETYSETAETDHINTICSTISVHIEEIARTPDASSSANLDVTCKLLRRLGKFNQFSSQSQSILSLLYQTFFQQKESQLVRSAAARRIMLLVLELIDENHSKSLLPDIFSKYISVVPFCLLSWATDFAYESQTALEFVLEMTRTSRLFHDMSLLLIRGECFENYPDIQKRLVLAIERHMSPNLEGLVKGHTQLEDAI